MKNKVQILSIKKNTIKIKIRSNRQSLLVPMCIACIAMFLLCFSFGGTSIKQVGSGMAYIYNPVNSLYSDNSNIVFASTLIDKENLDFVLPISGAKVELIPTGDIVLTVNNSIMVKACEGGIVEEVGTTIDGVKYIKIKHGIDIHSIIENVDILGVKNGDMVKKGQDIATAIVGEKVVFKLFMHNSQITQIKLNQSKIIWES